MPIITAFGIIELATASVAILGAFGMCLTKVIGQTEQSKCTNISCCCIKCDRDPSIQNVELPRQEPIRVNDIQTEIQGQSDFDEALNTIPRK